MRWGWSASEIKRADLHDGALWIVQSKTGAKRAIEITGEFAALIERISARPRERLSVFLIQGDEGGPLGTFGLRLRFAKVGRRAGVEFQFRVFGQRRLRIPATWRTRRSCWGIAIGR
jgi:hypothetical protein